MRSDEDIKTDVYKYIKCTPLVREVSGCLSKRLRPYNSKKEDIVISVVANEGIQEQTAILNVNIYVQDMDVKGQNEENSIRLNELCSLSWSALRSFCTEGYFARAIGQRVYPTDTGEHIINNKIEYKLIND